MVYLIDNEKNQKEETFLELQTENKFYNKKPRTLDDILTELDKGSKRLNLTKKRVFFSYRWLYSLFILPVILLVFMAFRTQKPLKITNITVDYLWSVQTLGPVFATPAIADIDNDGKNDVIIASTDGKLYVFDGPTGKRIWRFETEEPFISSPVVLRQKYNNKILIAGQDRRLYMLNNKSKCLWATIPQYFNSTAISTPVICKNKDRSSVVLAAEDGRVYSFDIKQGWLLWSSTGTKGKFFSTPLVVSANNDSLYDFVVGSSEGILYCLDGFSGKKIWELNLNGPISASPIKLDKESIIAADETGMIYTVETATGKIINRISCNSKIVSTPVIIKNYTKSLLIVPLKDGTVISFTLPEFNRMWTFDSNFQDGFVSTPAVADLNADKTDDIILTSRNGRCYFLDGRTGNELISNLFLDNSIAASPAIADINNDGDLDLIIASENGKVTALTIKTVPDKLAKRNSIIAGSFTERVFSVNNGLFKIF